MPHSWPLSAFNQTRMELKPNEMIVAALEKIAFNQTRMELKHVNGRTHPDGPDTFNQTRMELKPNEMIVAALEKIAFNQTRMELKRGNDVHFDYEHASF